jgi:hypothetical protein
LALLRQDKAKETLGHRLLEEALAARDQALLDALLDAAAKEKENGGERGKREGGEEGKGAEGEEPWGIIWESTIEIAVSLTGATNPVSFVAQRVPKSPPLGNKKPPRKSKGSEDSSGENSSESGGVKVTKANKKPKYVSLRLSKDWCDFVCAAFETRRILLEKMFGLVKSLCWWRLAWRGKKRNRRSSKSKQNTVSDFILFRCLTTGSLAPLATGREERGREWRREGENGKRGGEREITEKNLCESKKEPWSLSPLLILSCTRTQKGERNWEGAQAGREGKRER